MLEPRVHLRLQIVSHFLEVSHRPLMELLEELILLAYVGLEGVVNLVISSGALLRLLA